MWIFINIKRKIVIFIFQIKRLLRYVSIIGNIIRITSELARICF